MYGSSLPIGGQLNVFLSNYMRSYAQNNLIASLLAPTVPVTVRGGNYIVLDRSNQRVLASTLRMPGAAPVQLNMGYSKDVFFCRAHAAEVPLPYENQTAAAQYSLNLKMSAMAQVKDAIDIRREAEVAAIVRTGVTNNTPLSGMSVWSNTASNPIQQIEQLKLEILPTGRTASHIFLGPDVASAARQNPAIIERFKYSNSGGIITNSNLADAFGIPNVIEAQAVQVDGNNNASFLWAGLVVVAFVQAATTMNDLSPLKTFVDTTQGVDGYEALEFPDTHASKKTDWVSGEMAYDIKVTGQDTIAVLSQAA